MISLYHEEVRAPAWFQVLAWLPVPTLLTALIVPALTEDMGRDAYIFFLGMGLALAVVLVLATNFTAIQVQVTPDALRFGFGWFKHRVPLHAVRQVKTARYYWWPYGGWGLCIATGGRRAYSLPGIPAGAEVTVEERGRVRRYFVSSRRPEELAQALSRVVH
ncbi:MAG: hypothetical protein HYX99_02495 [Chloroflexi bacterium]|nr:hypothetical protein [Chloroflexota bacterium]